LKKSWIKKEKRLFLNWFRRQYGQNTVRHLGPFIQKKRVVQGERDGRNRKVKTAVGQQKEVSD